MFCECITVFCVGYYPITSHWWTYIHNDFDLEAFTFELLCVIKCIIIWFHLSKKYYTRSAMIICLLSVELALDCVCSRIHTIDWNYYLFWNRSTRRNADILFQVLRRAQIFLINQIKRSQSQLPLGVNKLFICFNIKKLCHSFNFDGFLWPKNVCRISYEWFLFIHLFIYFEAVCCCLRTFGETRW